MKHETYWCKECKAFHHETIYGNGPHATPKCPKCNKNMIKVE